jgi:hypothetical protein
VTTRREFRCNLCHDEIAKDGEAYTGFGIYFTATRNGERFSVKHPRDAEHHLCTRCVVAIKAQEFKPV